ncbi:beta-N-acetylhexosaminidase [Paenibacillus sp. HW567]|uniref:beta-N-acetylhexosaminidase n=1 Tax=Paenibacillus sp. HW567 TaxID=1034769 RepID=UPI0003662B62|nr:beta-N-acetylhexosaminidase [Paenibacillus sp. HW567]
MIGSDCKALISAVALTSLFLIGGCSGSATSNTASPGEAVPQQTVAAVPSPSRAALPTPVDTASPTASGSTENGAQEAITEQIAGMTLEEKIGQMLLVGIEGTALDDRANKMIAEDKVGGIILYADNIKSLKGMVKLTNDLKRSNEGNPAPLFISVDQEGGKVSRMPDEYAVIPANGKVGATGNAEAAGMMGRLLAREVLSAGFNMDFAPVLDINSNPDNPVIGDRSFGSTADRVTALGLAELKGIESEGVIPVVKHFPGHGDTSVDSHLELPVVNKTTAQLAKLEWLPFQAAFKEQADAVMVAHILFPKLDPKLPASLSKVIIGAQLRGQMGFNGVVITDDLTMGAIAKNYSLASAAVDTVLAGSDILLVAHEYSNEQVVRKALLTAVGSGDIPESRIDESVYRILSLKHKYQLTDNPVAVPDLTRLNQDIKAWRNTL